MDDSIRRIAFVCRREDERARREGWLARRVVEVVEAGDKGRLEVHGCRCAWPEAAMREGACEQALTFPDVV